MKIIKNQGNYFSIYLEPITFTQRENIIIYLHCLKKWNDNKKKLLRLEIDTEKHIFSFIASNKPFTININDTYTYSNLISLHETFQEFLFYLKETNASFTEIHPNHFIKIDDIFLYVGFEEICEYIDEQQTSINNSLSLFLKNCWKQDIKSIRYTPLHQIILL